MPRLDRRTRYPADGVDHLVDGRPGTPADVVDAGRCVEGGGGCVHRVRDVSHITLLFTVAEDLDRSPPKRSGDEARKGHFRALPGTVDAEIPQDRRPKVA